MLDRATQSMEPASSQFKMRSFGPAALWQCPALLLEQKAGERGGEIPGGIGGTDCSMRSPAAILQEEPFSQPSARLSRGIGRRLRAVGAPGRGRQRLYPLGCRAHVA